jgi:hypothetical protein
MSEESTLSTAEATGNGTTTGASPATRKKTSARGAGARRATARSAGASETFGVAEMPSESRAHNPSAGDPYHGGQRIWPD